jgi:hypothetical protein
MKPIFTKEDFINECVKARPTVDPVELKKLKVIKRLQEAKLRLEKKK